jgi:hypothetical protein
VASHPAATGQILPDSEESGWSTTCVIVPDEVVDSRGGFVGADR